MADRVVENQDNEVPEIPEILEKVLLFSLDEAKQKLSQSNEVVPFTALAVKENLFIENHPGESVEACFNAARHTVQHAQGAQLMLSATTVTSRLMRVRRMLLSPRAVCPAQIRASLWAICTNAPRTAPSRPFPLRRQG